MKDVKNKEKHKEKHKEKYKEAHKEEKHKEKYKEAHKEEKNEEEHKDYNFQLDVLVNSLYKNYLFFMSVLICLYKFKQNPNYNTSYIGLIVSFFIMSIFGYFSHYVSHHINFANYCKNTDNIFINNKYSGPIVKNIIKFLDFHDTIHHDTSINKQVINIIYEFINNVFLQGLAIVIFIKIIDIRVAILWAFMYATIHNINFLFIHPTTHRDHHINNHTNYGIDFCDILFNSKYDWNDIEIYNHGAINIIVITYIINAFT